MTVEERTELVDVAATECAVREHERRGRLGAVAERLDVTDELVPAGEPVARRQVAPRLVERDAAHGRDPLRTSVVVAGVGLEGDLETGIGHRAGSRTTTGIRRSVLVWYSA